FTSSSFKTNGSFISRFVLSIYYGHLKFCRSNQLNDRFVISLWHTSNGFHVFKNSAYSIHTAYYVISLIISNQGKACTEQFIVWIVRKHEGFNTINDFFFI